MRFGLLHYLLILRSHSLMLTASCIAFISSWFPFPLERLMLVQEDQAESRVGFMLSSYLQLPVLDVPSLDTHACPRPPGSFPTFFKLECSSLAFWASKPLFFSNLSTLCAEAQCVITILIGNSGSCFCINGRIQDVPIFSACTIQS